MFKIDYNCITRKNKFSCKITTSLAAGLYRPHNEKETSDQRTDLFSSIFCRPNVICPSTWHYLPQSKRENPGSKSLWYPLYSLL